MLDWQAREVPAPCAASPSKMIRRSTSIMTMGVARRKGGRAVSASADCSVCAVTPHWGTWSACGTWLRPTCLTRPQGGRVGGGKQSLNDEICGKWMPRAGVKCARGRGHGGKCKSAEAMENHRVRLARIRASSPETIQQWSRTSRLRRYGLSEDQFNRLVESQGNACGMCHEPFRDGRRVCIDHDHACCPNRERSCGKCVRGVLCLRCNTTLGHIERLHDLVQIYLNKPAMAMAV